MAAFLESRFGVSNARVLYDRPASVFAPIDRAPSASSFARRCSRGWASAAAVVGFIVCPTSWTEDEDFDVVIEAVLRLEERIRGWEAAAPARRFPDLVILVTGDGARRAEFERRFAGLPARRDAAAHALARARRLSARRRQRRSRACACIDPRRGSTSR